MLFFQHEGSPHLAAYGDFLFPSDTYNYSFFMNTLDWLPTANGPLH